MKDLVSQVLFHSDALVIVLHCANETEIENALLPLIQGLKKLHNANLALTGTSCTGKKMGTKTSFNNYRI